MLILLELDPDVVKPGWTPLVILIILAACMVPLFLSMRRQFRRIDVTRSSSEAEPGAHGDTDGAGAGAAPDTTTAAPPESSSTGSTRRP